MTSRSALTLSCLLALPLAACSGGDDDDGAIKTAPNIELFEASPATVEPGMTTTLRYRVKDAATVRIDVMGGASVLPVSPTTEGEVASPSLDDTTTFVLVATGLTGKNATASLTVLVQKDDAPQIIQFGATPQTIDAGDSTTLSWQIEGATSARIESGGSTIFTVPVDAVANGTFQHPPAQTATYTLVALSAAGTESRMNTTVTVNGSVPVIRVFRATPPTVDVGMSSELSWEVSNATQVTITDEAATVVYDGAELIGMRSVSPAVTTRYTLTASDGTNNVTQSVVVSVNAAVGAQIVSFTANPLNVLTGQPTVLQWEVTDAPGGISINVSGAPVFTSTLASGSTSVTPLVTTTYELVAINPAANDTQSLTVQVTPPNGPTILTFAANPNPVAAGAVSTLSWTTLVSTEVRVLEDGNQVFSSTTMVASGTFAISPNADTTYTLEATDGAQTTTRTLRVHAHPAPTIDLFTVTPLDIMGPTNVTVTWNVRDYATLTLTQDGAPVPGFSVPTSTAAALDSQGTLQVMVAQATLFVLTAESAGGTQTAQVQVGMPVVGVETEPNDDVASANPFDQGGQITGAIDVPTDADFFRIMVPEGGNVRAETSDGLGACTTDTVVFLLDANGDVITLDDDGGNPPCSLIDPTADPTAANLAAGTYYIAVVHYDPAEIGDYVLNVRIAGPMCGNTIIENNEQCDFGDFTNGDGCSGTCQLEINPTVISGTGGVVTVTLPLGGFAVVQVNVLAGQAITATAADIGGTACESVDTGLNLGDANLVLLGGKSDGGPIGNAGECAAIYYTADTFATNLEAGAHFLVLFNEGTTTGPVQLRVGIFDAVCGNGIAETNVEECDDGNVVSGDLCDATCNLEITGTVTLPSATPIVRAGALAAPTFDDLYQIDITAQTYITVDTFAPTQAGGGCAGTDTVVELYDASFNLLGGDDDEGVANCSSFDERAPFGLLAPGRYFLVVFDFGRNTAVPAYEVVFGSVAPGANPPSLEVEPNDTQALAQDLGLTGPGTATVQGQISPPPNGVDGDDDVWAFVVPANQTVMVSVRTYDELGNPMACTANRNLSDTRIFLEADGAEATEPGTGELAFNDDIDPPANLWCSAIPPTPITAGGQDTPFFVRVQGFEDDGLHYYFMDVTVQ